MSLMFEVPAEPSKLRVLVEPVGAVPEAQFPVVLQLVLPPPPVQLYVPAAEAGLARAKAVKSVASSPQQRRRENRLTPVAIAGDGIKLLSLRFTVSPISRQTPTTKGPLTVRVSA